MNILISAYACEPDKGSEPFLGWRWSWEIAKHNNVWVITRKNNRKSIERYLKTEPNENLHFVYIDVDGIVRKLKKGQRGVQLYYYFWQKKAAQVAKSLSHEIKFDVVHHLTFGAFTQPTFMYELDIPFVWGPIGGGEKLPVIRNRKIDTKSRFYETARNIQMRVYNFLPFTVRALKKASKILVTTQETYELIPDKYKEKTEIMQSLGIDEDFKTECDNYSPPSSNKIKILMCGRLISWKGMDIGIDAFKKLHRNDVELYIRGRGPLKEKLKEQCGSNLNENIFFCDDYLEYNQMYSFYKGFDIFLNCSLHDSGCLALLEAMSASLPVVCICTGGPKVITSKENAIRIQPDEYEKLITSISKAIELLVQDSLLRKKMGLMSYQEVENRHLYEKKYLELERVYKEVLSSN